MRSTFFTLSILVMSTLPGFAGTVVSGRITGPEGKELIKAVVLLRQPFDTAVVKMTDAGANGSYRINIPSGGVWILNFRGVHYADKDVAVYVDGKRKIGLDVSLGTYSYLDDFNNVKVVGSFNNWYTPGAVPLQKQPGGVYAASIKAKGGAVSYRLTGVRKGGSVEGNQSDEYTYRGSPGFASVVRTRNGIARIVFDPRKLERSEINPVVRFKDAPVEARFNRIYAEQVDFENDYRAAFRAQMRSRGRDPQNVKFDFSDVVASVAKQLQTEEEPIIRQELYFNYLRIYMISQRISPSFYTTLLKGITPSSPVWSLGANTIYYGLAHSDLSEKERDEYVRAVITTNPVRRVCSTILFDEFMASKLKEDKAKAADYFELLTGKYGDSPEAKHVLRLYGGTTLLAKGSRVPSFSVVSADNMVQHITDKTLRGKYALIVFWAAKDPASVDEINYVEKAYDEYGQGNLNILTISVDSSFSDLAHFREERTHTPWMNAYVGKDRDNEAVKAFRAYRIPKAFLIDPKGIIVETGESLIGPSLMNTLAAYLRK